MIREGHRESLTSQDLRLIRKALRVLCICSGGTGTTNEYLNKIEALDNKVGKIIKNESLQARWRRRRLD